MRAIVDTNQISKLCAQTQSWVTSIVLAPYVIAEVCLCHNPEPMLTNLRRFDIRYGLEPADTFDGLASLSGPQISSFEPFIKLGSHASLNDSYLGVEAHSNIVPKAKALKESNRKFCESMFERAQQIRRMLQSGGKVP